MICTLMCIGLGVDCPHEDVYGEEEIRVLACIVQKLLSQGTISLLLYSLSF